MGKSGNSSRKLTREDRRTKFLSSIKGYDVDQEAFTIDEICELKGISRAIATKLAQDNLTMGNWERVWKKGKNRLQFAYRIIN